MSDKINATAKPRKSAQAKSANVKTKQVTTSQETLNQDSQAVVATNPLSFDTSNVDTYKREFLTLATACVGAAGAAAVGLPFVGSMLPSERAKAAGAPVEVDISKLEAGAIMTVEWRGKPVWVIRRHPEQTAELSKFDAELSDPKSEVITQQPENCKNTSRSLKEDVSVVVGICTHLGCSPTTKLEKGGDMGENWAGGFFCPCHGSKFDLAGRVFKGSPAPTNLVVPPHYYVSETTLLIGEEKAGA